MFTDSPRVIEGYFECPVAFAVTAAALDHEYGAVVGGHPVTITLPSTAGTSMRHIDLSAPKRHYLEPESSFSELPQLAPFWGQVAVWANDHTTPKAANVRRFRLLAQTVGDDDHVRAVGRELACAARDWWSTVSAWIEILYGQDLSRLGPVEPGLQFSGTTLQAWLYSLHGHPIRDGALLPVGSNKIGVVWPKLAPITHDQLQHCINHGQSAGPPPTEWLLIRDANSMLTGRDFRRAVLDAGLAAELAVTRLVTMHLTANGVTAGKIRKTLRNHSMLGKRCEYWTDQCCGALPPHYRRRLIERRNTATHSRQPLSEGEVRDAISVATEIVEQAIPLPAGPA